MLFKTTTNQMAHTSFMQSEFWKRLSLITGVIQHSSVQYDHPPFGAMIEANRFQNCLTTQSMHVPPFNMPPCSYH